MEWSGGWFVSATSCPQDFMRSCLRLCRRRLLTAFHTLHNSDRSYTNPWMFMDHDLSQERHSDHTAFWSLHTSSDDSRTSTLGPFDRQTMFTVVVWGTLKRDRQSLLSSGQTTYLATHPDLVSRRQRRTAGYDCMKRPTGSLEIPHWLIDMYFLSRQGCANQKCVEYFRLHLCCAPLRKARSLFVLEQIHWSLRCDLETSRAEHERCPRLRHGLEACCNCAAP